MPKELPTNGTIMQWNRQNLSLMQILRVKINLSTNTHIHNKHELLYDAKAK